jgi:hypothetical protein
MCTALTDRCRHDPDPLAAMSVISGPLMRALARGKARFRWRVSSQRGDAGRSGAGIRLAEIRADSADDANQEMKR